VAYGGWGCPPLDRADMIDLAADRREGALVMLARGNESVERTCRMPVLEANICSGCYGAAREGPRAQRWRGR